MNPSALQFALDRVHVTQAIQPAEGPCPLVAGKPALVRAFVTGTPTNTFRPEVHVDLYYDGSLTETLVVTPSRRACPRRQPRATSP